jgi:hypothetical protein
MIKVTFKIGHIRTFKIDILSMGTGSNSGSSLV